MNPFFELRWPDVHSRLIAYIGDALSACLPSHLSVRIDEHVPEIVLASPVIDRWLEIRDRDGRLITAIEVLSPRNKEGNGRVSYLEKQVDYISCGVNLVEIALIRAGQPTVAASRAMAGEPQGTESIICVTRAHDRTGTRSIERRCASRCPPSVSPCGNATPMCLWRCSP